MDTSQADYDFSGFPGIRQFPGPRASLLARTSGVAHTMIARLTTSAVERAAVVGRHPSRGRCWPQAVIGGARNTHESGHAQPPAELALAERATIILPTRTRFPGLHLKSVKLTALGFGYFSSVFWYSPINRRYGAMTQERTPRGTACNPAPQGTVSCATPRSRADLFAAWACHEPPPRRRPQHHYSRRCRPT